MERAQLRAQPDCGHNGAGAALTAAATLSLTGHMALGPGTGLPLDHPPGGAGRKQVQGGAVIGWTRLRPQAEAPGQGNCPRTTDHHEGSGPVSAGRRRKGVLVPWSRGWSPAGSLLGPGEAAPSICGLATPQRCPAHPPAHSAAPTRQQPEGLTQSETVSSQGPFPGAQGQRGCPAQCRGPEWVGGCHREARGGENAPALGPWVPGAPPLPGMAIVKVSLLLGTVAGGWRSAVPASIPLNHPCLLAGGRNRGCHWSSTCCHRGPGDQACVDGLGGGP